jgi:hypothetical protein
MDTLHSDYEICAVQILSIRDTPAQRRHQNWCRDPQFQEDLKHHNKIVVKTHKFVES